MTAHELARQECEKYRSDGTCPRDKVEIRDGTTHFAPYPRCNLALGKPCRYFEESLLPWAETTTDKRREMELTEAKYKYEEMKHEYERGLGEIDLERGGNDGTIGVSETATEEAYPRGRTSRDQTGKGMVRLPLQRRAQVSRGKEIGSRISRIRC